MYKNLPKISNSNPRNPLTHHRPKQFPLFIAKSKIQKSKFQSSKVQKSKIPIRRDIFHKNREISIFMMKKKPTTRLTFL
jgi:hypothetical protein